MQVKTYDFKRVSFVYSPARVPGTKMAMMGVPVGATVWTMMRASVGASVRASVGASVRASVGARIQASLQKRSPSSAIA